ncbi:MAG: DUF6326 family protein [Candidatus Hermodarchaeia archaeon]
MKINVKVKLAALWVALLFLYTCGDILGFYTPGNLEQLISGEIEGIQLSEGLLIVNAVTMVIQSVMIFLSLALKANTNRWANLIIGVFALVVLVAATYAGGIDLRYSIQAGVELVLIALILWHALNWPKKEGAKVEL